jgi:hypothetical protein
MDIPSKETNKKSINPPKNSYIIRGYVRPKTIHQRKNIDKIHTTSSLHSLEVKGRSS